MPHLTTKGKFSDFMKGFQGVICGQSFQKKSNEFNDLPLVIIGIFRKNEKMVLNKIIEILFYSKMN